MPWASWASLSQSRELQKVCGVVLVYLNTCTSDILRSDRCLLLLLPHWLHPCWWEMLLSVTTGGQPTLGHPRTEDSSLDRNGILFPGVDLVRGKGCLQTVQHLPRLHQLGDTRQGRHWLGVEKSTLNLIQDGNNIQLIKSFTLESFHSFMQLNIFFCKFILFTFFHFSNLTWCLTPSTPG